MKVVWKSSLVLCFALALSLMGNWGMAQTARFNFMRGSETVGTSNSNNSGTYTALGADPTNNPGGRTGGAYVQAGDSLYIFGGLGYGASSIGRLSDLWLWNGSEWVWRAGASSVNAAGEYTAATKFPGGRAYAASWFDASENKIYIFGGRGYGRTTGSSSHRGLLSDLWSWDIASGVWTFEGGSDVINVFANTEIQGGQTTSPSPAWPASREFGHTWFANGKLYLFGGYGRTGTSSGNYDEVMDLWEYDPSTDVWLKLKGPLAFSGASDISYGSMGQSNATNQIGPRQGGATWVDANGDLWVFGGYGKSSVSTSSNHYLNDMWRYEVATGHWIWEGGSDGNNDLGTMSSPRARCFSTSWVDEDGGFWLYGGESFDEVNSVVNRAANRLYLSDLWYFDPIAKSWSEKSVIASFFTDASGIQSTGPSAFNIPRARAATMAYRNGENELIFFGGERFTTPGTSSTNEYLNDLWRLEYGFHIQGTWPSGTEPSADDNVYVRAALNLNTSSNHKAGNLFLDASLEIGAVNESNYDTLSVHGDLIIESNNPITGEGDLRIEGAGSHFVSGEGSVLLQGPNLVLSAGSVLHVNDRLKTATVVDDRSLCSIIEAEGSSSPGAISGDIGHLLYLPFNDADGNGIGDGAYHQFGTALTNVEFQDLNQGGILVSGNTTNSAQNSAWLYFSQQAQWISIFSPTLNISQGALSVYAGENAYGNFLFDSTSDYVSLDGNLYGELEISGLWRPKATRLFENLFYHNGQGVNTGFVGGSDTAATEGWNMVLNPVNSFVDIEAILSDGLTSLPANVLYVWDAKTESYRSYSHNGSTLVLNPSGIDAYLLPGQCFWVQAAVPVPNVPFAQSPSQVNFDISSAHSRIVTLSSGAKQNANDGLRLYLAKRGGLKKQESWLGFASWASNEYDARAEAWFLEGHADHPFLSTGAGLNGEHKLSINYISNNSPMATVPVYAGLKSGHQEVLEFSLNIDLMHSYADVLVEDLKTGDFSRPYGKDSYAFVNDTVWSGPRLKLHLSNSIAIDLAENQEETLFYAYRENDNIMVRFAQSVEDASLKVFAPDGRLLQSYKDLDGNRLQLSGLQSRGIYLIEWQSKEHQGLLRMVY